MTEKELVKKLNNLRKVQPDAAWKKQNREILLSQISNASVPYQPSYFSKLMMWSKNFTLSVPRPAMAFSGLIAIIITGMAVSNNTFVSPSDTLNIARIISEKAKLSFTFDEAEKNKMQMRFASNHAKEIASTLSTQASAPESQDSSELRDSFKEEIARMREHLSAGQPMPAVKVQNDASVSAVATSSDDAIVSTANSSRDAQGIELAGGKTVAEKIVEQATSTIAAPKTASEILEDAEKLFNDKNYKEAADMLSQVDSLIKQ